MCKRDVADLIRGHFVWVDIGSHLGFRDVVTEKKVFQRLLDGGVYIVSSGRHTVQAGKLIAQAPGSAYHSTVPGWFRVTFSVARDDLLVS